MKINDHGSLIQEDLKIALFRKIDKNSEFSEIQT